MAVEITVPELGESVLDATVSRWLKKEGDFVHVGEVLVELETDKVNLEVGAKNAGVLQKIEVNEGADVKVGDVLGRIDAQAGEQKAEAQNAETPKAETQRAEPASVETTQLEPQAQQTGAPSGTDGQQVNRQAAPQISPVAARLARDKNVDVSKIMGTGSEGRVTKADVEMYLQKQETAQVAEKPAPAEKPQEAAASPSPSAPPSDRREERTRMSRRRRTIAQRLLEASQSTAMLTTFNEIDMSAIMDIRKKHNDEFQKRYGVKLGFMSFFVKASISALKAFPQINAEIAGEEIVFKHYYDIGMAVGSEEGLVVPVVREADRLSFAEIEQRIKDLVAKTQEGKLSIEDLRGGTFTITNGGVFGSLLSTPILNPPQVGILGLHKIEERPIALNGQVVIRPMMYVALSYDHRIVDGREAVQFLVHIKQVLEDPAWMLVGG
ncbi:MAG TPA: 2-oxoglutarate dehydrogenase complex dihydrolipoyllysine-residue succinyltransferase [Anaerolineales bacterium]|jgi:2-oxoglutarate dehydrogenase E2 component (dihydrolipoamide succinyltransferase)|nr:2-oxoglutarate dehydrogenase complex dihydrolipoyllysine-residue succinyltransferase [Anaerolineales bacterium]